MTTPAPGPSEATAEENNLKPDAGMPTPARRPGVRLPHALAALRHRNFRLFWFAQVISLIGSWMQIIGQAWLVLELTHSAWQLGVVGALQSLPILLFALFGGVLADRWPKRRVLMLTQAASAIQALLLWVLIVSGAVQVWHLYVLALLLGLTNSLGRPTSSSFVVELVGREDLQNAIALNSSLANLARIVGPGLGGVLIAARGVSALFLLNAISFLPVILALALMNTQSLHAVARRDAGEGQRLSTWQSLREGLAYVWRTPPVLLLIVVAGLALLFGSNFNVVLPVFATDVLRTGAEGFGWLSAAIGIGSLLATLWLAGSKQHPTIRRVLLGALLFGVLEMLFGVAHLLPLSLLLIAGVGFAEMAYMTMAITLLQTIAPDHLRGRVMSVAILFFDGSVPPGYLLVGWLAGLFGPAATLVICGALSLLVAATGWLLRKPAEAHIETAAVRTA